MAIETNHGLRPSLSKPSTLNPTPRNANSGPDCPSKPNHTLAGGASPQHANSRRAGDPVAARGLPPRQATFPSRTTLATPAVTATAGPVILFTAGGMRFAVEANEVAEIRDGAERGAFNGFKGSDAIDFAQCVGLGAGRLEHFVVLKLGNCSLGVTAVERMTTLPKMAPLPGLFRGTERQWYRGLLLLENEVVPLVRTEYWRQGTVIAGGER